MWGDPVQLLMSYSILMLICVLFKETLKQFLTGSIKIFMFGLEINILKISKYSTIKNSRF